MSYSIESKVNGVTKRERDGTFFYYFPKATVRVNANDVDPSKHTIELRQLDNFPNFEPIIYSEITNKLGSSTAEEYVDELAIREFFFEVIPGEQIQLFQDVSEIVIDNKANRIAINETNDLLRDVVFWLKAIAE